jgi:hypothetical protein
MPDGGRASVNGEGRGWGVGDRLVGTLLIEGPLLGAFALGTTHMNYHGVPAGLVVGVLLSLLQLPGVLAALALLPLLDRLGVMSNAPFFVVVGVVNAALVYALLSWRARRTLAVAGR